MASDQRVCPVCAEENPARASFCLACGTRFPTDIVDALPQQARGGERRIVTVLFADLSGFTSFSEQTDVEEVRAIARETADRLGEIVVRYGGTVDKIIGDCVMAVWGAPTSYEDDPERGVRAALDMQAHISEHADRFAGLPLSIGLNTGEAIWAPVGGQHTVLGDTVNTAARLQGAAARGEILVGDATYEATQGIVEYETLEPITMKNKREPVPAFRPLSVRGAAPRRRTKSLPLVARETERERLWELWERVRTEKHPYGAVVLGAPGIGKSRLVRAITDDAGSGAIVLRGACLPYGEGITYWPVIEMIKQAAAILHDDDHTEVSRKLGALLESLGSDDLDELRTMAVALANLIGEPTTPRGTYSATEISKRELHWGLRRILELASRRLPVVLVLEDLHWAEPVLLELILHILEPRTEAPLFGLATARPEFRETGDVLLAPRPNSRVLELEALTEDASIEMIRRLVGGEGDVPEATLRQLLEASGGNPLFLEETIQTWVDAGADAEALALMAVPSGLQALIASRLDRLPADEKRVLSHASVIGDVFWSGGLSELEGTDGAIDRVLASLEERDLVRTHDTTTLTGQREYGFKHGLIREVAYARMPKSERADLHERCGSWIATIGSDEFAEIIAYHLEEACKLAAEVARSAHPPPVLAAVQALSRAAEKSEAREGVREAARFYERALAVAADRFPETVAELRLRRARMTAFLGRLDDAYAQLSEAAEAGLALGRPELRCRALVNLADTDLALGRASEARRHLEEAEAAASKLADPRHRIRTAFVRAVFHTAVDASPRDAVEDLKEAAALAEEVGDPELRLAAHLRLGSLLHSLGELAGADAEFRRASTLAREQGSLFYEAVATRFLAAVCYHRGPRGEAEDLALRAAEWLGRIGDLTMQCQALELLGAISIARGDLAEAEARFRRALAASGGDQIFVTGSNRYLAEVFALRDEPDRAKRAARAARAAVPEAVPYADAFALMAEAFAAAASGDASEAQRLSEAALALFEQQDLTLELTEARLVCSRALARLGSHEWARAQLSRARETFERMGATASVADIDREISRM